MNFEEAGQRYVVLREQFENGAISQEQFVRAVGQLVVTAPDGKTWGLDPFAATWVEMAAPARPASAPRPQTREPQNMWQLIVTLAVGMVKSLPRMLLTGLIMAALTWVAHTYIIAAINDGVVYREARVVVNSLVHLKREHSPGVNLFWGIFSYFLNNFFMRALQVGPWNWLKSIVQLPNNIKFSVQRDKALSWTIILVGALAALLIMLQFRNFMVSWILAIGILLLLTARFASLEVLVIRTALLDLQRLVKRRFVPQGDEYNSAYLLLVGMCCGFLLVGMWRARMPFTLVGMALVVVLLVLGYWRQHKARTALIFFIVGSGLLLYESAVFAWCEGTGLSGAGGNWLRYLATPGARTVARLGMIPAAFSFAGGIFGAVAANLGALLSSIVPSMTAEMPPTYDPEIPRLEPREPSKRDKERQRIREFKKAHELGRRILRQRRREELYLDRLVQKYRTRDPAELAEIITQKKGEPHLNRLAQRYGTRDPAKLREIIKRQVLRVQRRIDIRRSYESQRRVDFYNAAVPSATIAEVAADTGIAYRGNLAAKKFLKKTEMGTMGFRKAISTLGFKKVVGIGAAAILTAPAAKVMAGYFVVKSIAGSMADDGVGVGSVLSGIVEGGAKVVSAPLTNSYAKAVLVGSGKVLGGGASDGDKGARKGLEKAVFAEVLPDVIAALAPPIAGGRVNELLVIPIGAFGELLVEDRFESKRPSQPLTYLRRGRAGVAPSGVWRSDGVPVFVYK